MFKKTSVFLFAGLLVLSACAPALASPTAVAENTATAEPQAPTAEPEVVKLKVGILNFMSNSPIFIAQDDGYFVEQGLEVELVNFGTSERDMIPALLQSQVDVAAVAVGTSTLNGIAQGANVKYVADKGYINPEASCFADGWVARKGLLDSGELEVSDALKGLRFTFSAGNTFEYVADLLLEQAGITQADIQILDIRDQAARMEAFGANALDLTPISEPWITRTANAGAGGMWIPFSEVIPEFSVGTMVYGPGMLERDTEVGVRFMTAYLKAVEQFNQGKTDRNVEIIAGYTQLDPEEIKEICWPSYQPDGKINTEGLERFGQWALDKGYLDGPVTIDQIWDPQFVDQANAIMNK